MAGASTFALKSPSTSEVKVYGANFPADLKPADFDLGKGIKVTGIVHREPSVATVNVAVDSGLPTGIRDLTVRHSTAERAIAVYDKVAYIKVMPDASMARLGGTIRPNSSRGLKPSPTRPDRRQSANRRRYTVWSNFRALVDGRICFHPRRRRHQVRWQAQ